MAYSKPCQTTKLKIFQKIINGWILLALSVKNIHLRCLIEFWICVGCSWQILLQILRNTDIVFLTKVNISPIVAIISFVSMLQDVSNIFRKGFFQRTFEEIDSIKCFSLHKIHKNMGFFQRTFEEIDSIKCFSLHKIHKNMGFHWPVFLHILCSVCNSKSFASLSPRILKITENISSKISKQYLTLHKKWSFPSKISSVNVTKSAFSYGFGHIYWRNT